MNQNQTSIKIQGSSFKYKLGFHRATSDSSRSQPQGNQLLIIRELNDMNKRN